MRNIFTTLITLFTLSVISQEVKSIYPDFSNKKASEVLSHKNWQVLTKIDGFLDNDKQIDSAIVLESKDSVLETKIGRKPRKNIARILVVFINDKLIVQNNTFLSRADEGGMANYIEPEIETINNQLKIYYQYIRSNTSYIFRYKKKNLVLTEAKSNYVQSSTGNYENLEYDFINKLLHIETGNISEEGETKKQILIKLKNGLKKLSELTEMYEWEVLKDRYL
jgi:hypothetical protein